MAEHEAFIAEKRLKVIEKKWEEAQVTAASAQSVLDYMVEIFNANKEELTEEQIKETEEQISIRQKEVEEFLMQAKDEYTQQLKEHHESL